MPRFRDSFEDDSSDVSTSGSDNEKEETKPAAKKPKQAEPSLEALREVGLRAGPSILTIREQPDEPNYAWGRGGRDEDREEDEDFEERERTRAAATYGTEAGVKRAIEAKQQAVLERERERAAHAEAQQKRRESFQQREKRKRELGQAKKGKNYVEEEKRLLRQHNVYSGFDN